MKYELRVAKSFITFDKIELHEKYGFKVTDREKEEDSAYVDDYDKNYIDIFNVEQLEGIQKDWSSKIVLDSKNKVITIYNGYLE